MRFLLLTALAHATILTAPAVDGSNPLPAPVLASAKDGQVMIRFAGRDGSLAGGVFDVRLTRAAKP